MIVYFSFLILYGIIYLGMFGKPSSMTETTLLRKKKQYCVLLVLGLSMLIGFRAPSVGIDTEQYLYRYNNYEYMMNSLAYKSEFGYNWLNYIFNKMGAPWQFFLFVMSLFTSWSLVRYIGNYTNRVYFPTFLFITIGTFAIVMTGIRQCTAVALCYLAIVIVEKAQKGEIKRSNIILSIILWLISVSIHNSAVIFGLYFLICNLRLSKKSIWIAIIVSFLSLVYGRYLISLLSFAIPRRYASMSFSAGYRINPLVIVVAVAMPVYSLMMCRTEDDGRFSKSDSVLFLFSVFGVLFTCLSVNNNQIGRLVYYFSNANIILIPKATNVFKGRSKLIAALMIAIVCIIYFYMSSSGGTFHIDEYKFFWQN